MKTIKKLSLVLALSISGVTIINAELNPAQPVKSFANPIVITIKNESNQPLVITETISGGQNCKWLPTETIATIPANTTQAVSVKIPHKRASNLFANGSNKLLVTNNGNNPQPPQIVNNPQASLTVTTVDKNTDKVSKNLENNTNYIYSSTGQLTKK